jgi:hypothetical protein
MRVEAKGNRALVKFDKIGESARYTQVLSDWCDSHGMYPEQRANGLSVKFNPAGNVAQDLEELKAWCAEHTAEDLKQQVVARASEFIADGKPTTPMFSLERITVFAMWHLWYRILRERFSAIHQPKDMPGKEKGILTTFRKYYDDQMIENIFQTAVRGWDAMLSKHRGMSEIPNLELILRFKDEIQLAASSGGFKQTGKKAERTTEHDEQINVAAEKASAELAERQRAEQSGQ